jgi:tripartite ATP-independent transporter DctM subunit
MGLVGFGGFAYIAGVNASLGVLKTVPFTTFGDYNLTVVPLFILMGSLAYFTGISKNLYDTVHSWLGHLRGGLAMATVGACAGFAAISGSSLATAATFAKVALPEMERYKYDKALATGCIAAGGTIGSLIPPSVIFIIYAIITEQSIGKLFLAGFFPGILEAIFYMLTISILCWRNPAMGPRGPQTTLRQKFVSLKGSWFVVVLFLIVIGGLYMGWFSPTEAAGIGAFGVFIFGVATRTLGWQNFKDSLSDTGKTTAMIFLLLLGAMIFGYFLSVSRISAELADFMSGLPVSPYVIMVIIMVFYIILGCMMDSLAMILITVPVFYPLILALGFDPIWFGVIIVRVTEIGLITPPVGLNLYVLKGSAKDIAMGDVIRGILPFLIADVFHVALLIIFPQISLFLPSLMKY